MKTYLSLFFKFQACVLKRYIMWKKKYSFWLQKGAELENEYHFWNLWMLTFWQCYNFLSHEINFERSSARNNGNTFFLVFYEKIRKTRKYSFWLQKVVKIWIWQYFIDGQSSNCVSLHFSIIFRQIFFMVRSHGFDGLFAAFDVACLKFWLKKKQKGHG